MRVEESSQVACFILCWLFLKRGGFLHSADAKGLNDKWGTFLRIRLLFLKRFTPPRGPHQARPGEPASPEGNVINLSTPLSNSSEIIRVFHGIVLFLPLFRTVFAFGYHRLLEAGSHFYVQALSPYPGSG